MTMQRLPDWKPRLAKVLNERRSTPFDAGRHDCVILAIDTIRALTGVRARAVTWRGTGHALEIMKKVGYEAAFGVNHLLGEPLDDWRLLRVGDLARLPPELGNLPGVETYGVFVGNATLIVPGRSQLIMVPAEAARKVWRVG